MENQKLKIDGTIRDVEEGVNGQTDTIEIAVGALKKIIENSEATAGLTILEFSDSAGIGALCTLNDMANFASVILMKLPDELAKQVMMNIMIRKMSGESPETLDDTIRRLMGEG
jgi:hypothetical protein